MQRYYSLFLRILEAFSEIRARQREEAEAHQTRQRLPHKQGTRLNAAGYRPKLSGEPPRRLR